MSEILDTQTLSNVRIEVRERGKLVTVRESHNVFTNTGRVWQARLYGSSDFSVDPPTPLERARPKFVSLGCGGVLQTDSRFSRRQVEVQTVTHLEDPVPYYKSGETNIYLKRVYDQSTSNTLFFPTAYRPSFVVDFAEGEIAFEGNTAYTSNQVVNTVVPVSEVGLHLSSATVSPVDPLAANALIAYNLQEPIPVTPSNSFRVIWELRV